MRGREKEKIERKKRAEEAQGTEQKSDRGQAAMRRRGRGGRSNKGLIFDSLTFPSGGERKK